MQGDSIPGSMGAYTRACRWARGRSRPGWRRHGSCTRPRTGCSWPAAPSGRGSPTWLPGGRRARVPPWPLAKAGPLTPSLPRIGGISSQGKDGGCLSELLAGAGAEGAGLRRGWRPEESLTRPPPSPSEMRGCRGSAGSCAAAVRALRQGAPARPASPALLPWRLLPSRSRPTARSRHRCG
jgi:hypothetical protein